MGVHWALEAIKELGCDVELIDLRTLLPWDQHTVLNSVRKTGRVIVVHEDCLTGGIGGEIAAVIADQAFRYLDAPVMRHGAMDTPVPFALSLEQQFLGVDRFKFKLKDLLDY
jgi:2-oxoisovalerate dehydrogenase E1 component